jgi:hemolysin activation/secretion protein
MSVRNCADGSQPMSRTSRYASALLAIGLSASVVGMLTPFARADDNAQAVDPVNVGGQHATTPDAAVPAARIPNTRTPTEELPPVASSQPTLPPTVPVPSTTPLPAVSQIPGPAPTLTPSVETKPAEQPAVTQTPTITPPGVIIPPATATAPAESAAAPMTSPSTAPASALSIPSASHPPPPPIPASSVLAANADGKSYPLTGVRIDYFKQHSSQPPIDELLNMPIKLGVTEDGLVAPRAGVPSVDIRLGDIGRTGPHHIYRSGITSVYGQIVKFFNDRGIIGVFVVVDAKDIDAKDDDLRPPTRTTLQFIVVTSVVKQVRTVATGNQVEEGHRVDNPRYQSIKDHSPLQAGDDRDDLLNKDALDDYVLRLNRQPGRRVDVAVSGTGEIGGVNLDYLVAENRPWYVYAQVSNTGTAETNSWRERFGGVDNQLTGHNDILTLDYSTAGFDASQAVVGSYELPFLDFDRVRYRIYGSWNQYTASDVGQSKEQFTGSEWTAGNELTANIFQHRDLFIDVVGGFRFQNVQTEGINGNGDATYFSPYASLRAEKVTDVESTTASATLVGFFTDANVHNQIVPLGRSNVTQNSLVLQFEAAHSMFLEPLLNLQGFEQGKSTLANELYVGVHGQYAFDYRLIPQDEDIAGGLYSVRGYPESIVAGDTVFVVTSEYRLHIPRLFPIQPDPTKTPFLWDKSFRYSPQQAYGHPDWDLIARAFVDVGRVLNTDHLPTDNNSTLVGTGVGLEFLYKQNFDIRCDWGVALNDIRSGVSTEVESGSNRFHISATLLY